MRQLAQMIRKRALVLAGIFATLVAVPGCVGPVETSDSPPNVLLVIVDTLRADRLGSYGFGQPTSPNLDALAARGVRVQRHYTAVPTTLASFTTLLTGRYPHSHGVYRNGVSWPESLEGIPTIFGGGGYDTAAFIASYCLTSRFGIARGFDHFDEELTVAIEGAPLNKLIRRGEDVTDRVITWLDARREDAPFFAMVHYFDPHWPYQPPAPFDGLFDPGYAGPIVGSVADVIAMRKRLELREGRPDSDTDHLHALHLGEIRYTDTQIARLLAALEERRLDASTLIVVTADHGEGIYEHDDYFNHGMTVYDTNIRIPLILSGPGISGDGRVLPGPYSSVDLAPTLLEYAGLEVPEAFEGRSFLAALTGEASANGGESRRDLFAEATKPTDLEVDQDWPNRLKARCVIRGRHKLVRWPTRRTAIGEFYDLVADPDEVRNLLVPGGDQGRGVRRTSRSMGIALDAWSAVVPDAVPHAAETDPDVLERLRSLGYGP